MKYHAVVLLLLVACIAYAQPTRAMDVEIFRDAGEETHTVFMTGMVDFGDAKKLREISEGRTISWIFVRSYGGYVEAGLETAALIREMNIPVVAFGWCQSACTFLLSAGSRKIMISGTQVGFHRPYFSLFGFIFELMPHGPTWHEIYATFKAGFRGNDIKAELWIITTYSTPSLEMTIVSDDLAYLYGIEVLKP